MLVEKVIGNKSHMDLSGLDIDIVPIEWYELDKKLMKKDSKNGEEIGIRVVEKLEDGDVLYMDGNKVMLLEVQPCDLTVVQVHTMEEMGRLCFELGNRHLSLSIHRNEVSVVYDEPTFAYLEKLGFAPTKRFDKFTNVTVCHAHGHGEGHEHSHKHENGHSHT